MKALLLKEYRKLEIVEMPVPPVAPDEVLVRVRACGICGSDVHGWDGSSGRRIPPIVMGHEAAGEVAETGDAVRGFRAGDRVTFDSTVYCGRCPACRRGDVNLCDHRNVLGVSCSDYRRHGAFAEYVAVPQQIVYPLPDSLPFEHAAMIEAASIAFHGVGRAPVRLGCTVLVVGAGMIGQLVVQAARLAGCGRLVAVDLDPQRLELARRFGADVVLPASTPDLQERIRQETGGIGADVAFEAVGSGPAFQTALAGLRKGGSASLIGNLAPSVEMPLQQVVTREITLYGSCASAGEYPACIEMLSRRRVEVAPLISAVAPLEEGPAWFDRLYRREEGVMKVVLRP